MAANQGAPMEIVSYSREQRTITVYDRTTGSLQDLHLFDLDLIDALEARDDAMGNNESL